MSRKSVEIVIITSVVLHQQAHDCCSILLLSSVCIRLSMGSTNFTIPSFSSCMETVSISPAMRSSNMPWPKLHIFSSESAFMKFSSLFPVLLSCPGGDDDAPHQ